MGSCQARTSKLQGGKGLRMSNAPEENPTPAQVTLPLLEFTARSYLFYRRNALRPLERNLRTDPVLRREIDAVGGLSTALATDPEDPVSLLYTSRFIDLQNAALLSQFFGNTEAPIPDVQTVFDEIKNITRIATATKDQLDDCCAELKQEIQKLQDQLRETEKRLNKHIDDAADLVIDKTTENVVNNVVGESFYRYVSTTTFAPTLILLFNEKSDEKYKRRCQYKFKILKTSEEIDQKFIDDLREDFRVLKQRHFYYGNTRTTYVSADKQIRNVVYAKNKEEATNMLKFIYPILGYTYDDKNASYTVGRNRAAFHKRKQPLDNIQPLDLDYNVECYMELKRVVLHVSALGKPIVIYRNDNL